MISYPTNQPFESLITYLAPGFVVACAVVAFLLGRNACLLFFSGETCDVLPVRIEKMVMLGPTGAVLVTGASFMSCVVCGAIVSALANILERKKLDKRAKEILQDDRALFRNVPENGFFDQHWNWYITNLPPLKNSFVSRTVLRLHYTSRFTVALIFWFFVLITIKANILLILIVLASAIVCFYGSVNCSLVLASFRAMYFQKYANPVEYIKHIGPLVNKLNCESCDCCSRRGSQVN